jgi:ligand-binding sensor domain-containing protein
MISIKNLSKRLMMKIHNAIYLVFCLVVVSACSHPGAPREDSTALPPTGTVESTQTLTAERPHSTETPTFVPEPVRPVWQSFTNGNYIRAMLVDQYGDLWTGGNGGAVHWNTRTGAYTKYTAADGLAGNFVTSIAQSSDGAIWFGTCRGGISRFDGRVWKTYAAFTDTYPQNCVTSIAVAPDGTIWFGSYSRLLYFDGNTWDSYSLDDLPIKRIKVLAAASDGVLWAGGEDDDGLFRYDGSRWQDFSSYLPSRSVTALGFDPDGALWVGTDNKGLARYKDGAWKTIALKRGAADERISVSSIAFQPGGKIWVGLTLDTVTSAGALYREQLMAGPEILNGVLYYDGSNWSTLGVKDGLASNEVLSIQVDQKNQVWLGTFDHGISRYNGVDWLTYQTGDTLRSNWINDLDMSENGVLWVAEREGVSRYDPSGWESHPIPREARADIWAIKVTGDSSVWLGTPGGIAHLENQNWITYFSPKYEQLQSVNDFALMPNGALVTSTYEGAYILEGGEWQLLPLTADLDIRVIAVHPDGSIWFGTNIDGIYVVKDKRFVHYTSKDGLASDFVDALAIDRDGGVWVGTDHGLSYFSDGHWQNYDPGKAAIVDLAVDSKNHTWVATKNGLYHFDGQRWLSFKSNAGLADNYIEGLQIGKNGELWVATMAGLSLLVNAADY